MNDQSSDASALPPEWPATVYYDRSTGLVVFGILTIGLGLLTWLLILVMLSTLVLPSAIPNPPTLSILLPSIGMYASLGIALVWLGVGSILARRWARDLMLIFSWSWLGMGVLMMIGMAFMLPRVFANLPATAGHPVPAGARYTGMAIACVVDGFLFVVLPAIWTFFYSSRHVKATCESRNPLPAWTDACPLPVLGLSLWLLFAVPMMLLSSFIGHPVLPFFGMFATGWAAGMLYVLLAVVWCISAWRLYRLDRRGWWLVLAVLSFGTVSTVLTYAQHDVMEMYRLMDFPPAQLDQIQKMGFLSGNRILWLMPLSVLPFLGYLFFIRRYFRWTV